MCGGNILLHCTYNIHCLGAKKEVEYEEVCRNGNNERGDQETAEQSILIASYNHFMSILVVIIIY